MKLSPNILLFWDLFEAQFDSRPELQSGFYIAVIDDNEMETGQTRLPLTRREYGIARGS
ncbi:hypothetical protein C1H46_018737 [Malus baccata]|uniref:Uncharacterized protein n=1 Tax=Malus baccata TaxID=106549 RepID=A0A540MAT7_MALBA|nr:hypothetical protein C1H46_018736 [Malus baccata]TQD95589.1 hypothetical protein C1H46_018737 [Malus baccata]